MRKDFSFKNYFVYAFRYWLVLAILAVVGLASGVLYGIFTDDKDSIIWRGSVSVGDFELFDTYCKDISAENPGSIYDRIVSGAVVSMGSDASADKLKKKVYDNVCEEWKGFKLNLKKSDKELESSFYSSLTVTRFEKGIVVSFKINADKSSSVTNKYSEFSERVVNEYLTLARDNAKSNSQLLGDDGKLTVEPAIKSIVLIKKGAGLIKSMIIGVVLGVVLGFVSLLVVYLFDRRITSYGDIAELTGRRLISADKEGVSAKACPAIDCEMRGGNMLLVCGSEDVCRKLSGDYGSYALSAGNKTLLIDFSGGAGSDTYGEYLSGTDFDKCATDNGGVKVLYGKHSWALSFACVQRLNELKKQFDKIVVCAPYYGDGALGVISKECNKVVFAVEQSKMSVNDVLHMAVEAQAEDKALGAVIANTNRAFVGGDVYVEPVEEE